MSDCKPSLQVNDNISLYTKIELLLEQSFKNEIFFVKNRYIIGIYTVNVISRRRQDWKLKCACLYVADECQKGMKLPVLLNKI